MAPSYGTQGHDRCSKSTVGAGHARDSSLVGGMAPSYGKRGHGPLLRRNERGEKT